MLALRKNTCWTRALEGLLPPLFVKALEGFTDLLLECFALVLGGQQSVHCFLVILTLLQQTSAVTGINEFSAFKVMKLTLVRHRKQVFQRGLVNGCLMKGHQNM